jgi:hypothetical protein
MLKIKLFKKEEDKGVWRQIIVKRNPETGYPVYPLVCKRCGYVPDKGEIMWRHKLRFKRRFSRPKVIEKVDYRCPKCYEELWM